VGTAVAAAVVVVALLAGGAHNTIGSPAQRPPVTTTTSDGGRFSASGILAGNGIATAHFGQPFAKVKRELQTGLGPARHTEPGPGMCGLDKTDLVWRRFGATHAELVLYFRRARFAGYSYASGSGGRGKPLRGLSTQKGLKLGDTMARGRKLYGKAFHTSTAQGGSWSVKVPGGKLIGYAVPPTGQPVTGPRSRVASIDAGNVGCPAMTP
jgi:hypothetical protein